MLTSLKGDGSTNIKCLRWGIERRRHCSHQYDPILIMHIPVRHLSPVSASIPNSVIWSEVRRKWRHSSIHLSIRLLMRLVGIYKGISYLSNECIAHLCMISLQSFALASSSVIYLICRDSVSIAVDTTSARILAQLLKLERPANMSESVEKQYQTVSFLFLFRWRWWTYLSLQIWSIFSSYLEKMESSGRKISFDLAEDELSVSISIVIDPLFISHNALIIFISLTKWIQPSSLILEALVFVLTNSRDADLKNDLLSLGILQWIVARGILL